MTRCRLRVPASTANLGSGFDTIGLAVNRYLTATYAPSADVGTLVIDRRGTLAPLVPLHDERDLFVRALRSGLTERGVYAPKRRRMNCINVTANQAL